MYSAKLCQNPSVRVRPGVAYDARVHSARPQSALTGSPGPTRRLLLLQTSAVTENPPQWAAKLSPIEYSRQRKPASINETIISLEEPKS
jgi:hypothetical protein